MSDFRERRSGGRADQLVWAIITDQMRKFCLKLIVAAYQRIIFGVANLWRVIGVIPRIVISNLFGQTHQFIRGFGWGHK